MYEQMGRAHAELVHLQERSLRRQAGQGTVEYVGLVLLLAVVVAGVIAAANGKGGDIATTVITKLKNAIEGVGSGKKP